MNAALKPSTLVELVDAVRSAPRVIAVGAGTKSRLVEPEGVVDRVRISTAALTGIVEYEPDEFTFTARAGTTLRELVGALAERGQYLPFDPPWVDAGATLGGTVAAGLSGPGSIRFGGIRDFILGVRFVDGTGRLVRLGGKVVKNAAGFDVPKFLCGSLGRFGVLGELTFKVFPRPLSTRTLRLHAATPEERLRILTRVARSRWEPDALEGALENSDVWLRLVGPAGALDGISREVLAQVPGEDAGDAPEIWATLREFRWSHAGGILVKVPVTPSHSVSLSHALHALHGFPEIRHQIGAGGNVAWISLASPSAIASLQSVLVRLELEALTLRGPAPLWWVRKKRPAIESAVKLALDPAHRFPALDS